MLSKRGKMDRIEFLIVATKLPSFLPYGAVTAFHPRSELSRARRVPLDTGLTLNPWSVGSRQRTAVDVVAALGDGGRRDRVEQLGASGEVAGCQLRGRDE
jgi:hypothetical protein